MTEEILTKYTYKLAELVEGKYKDGELYEEVSTIRQEIDRRLKSLDEIVQLFEDMHNQTSSELVRNLYHIVDKLEG